MLGDSRLRVAARDEEGQAARAEDRHVEVDRESGNVQLDPFDAAGCRRVDLAVDQEDAIRLERAERHRGATDVHIQCDESAAEVIGKTWFAARVERRALDPGRGPVPESCCGKCCSGASTEKPKPSK